MLLSTNRTREAPLTADLILVTLTSVMPERRKRQVFRDARAGRFPGARVVGRTWMISLRDWRSYVDGQGRTPVADADAILRARGYAV